MGYSICGIHNRRTCDACDGCPRCYGTDPLRTIRCPFNWCGPFRACSPCIKEHGISRAKAKHQECQRHSARFHTELRAQENARRAGLPVISAGVSCGEGKVFAWTNLGNFRLPLEDYHKGLARIDKVLNLDRAEPTDATHPKEVYGGSHD